MGSRFTLHGLFLAINDGILTDVGTDGHRLAIETWELPGIEGTAWSGIIPKCGIQQLAKQLDDLASLSLGVSDQRLFNAHVRSFRLTSRPIEGECPNWRALAPKHPASSTLTISRDELTGALHLAALVANRDLVALEYREGGVTLTAKPPAHGEAHEEIHTSYCGHSFKTGFQASYLLDTLGALDGDVVVL